jgi:hypothetical protein
MDETIHDELLHLLISNEARVYEKSSIQVGNKEIRYTKCIKCLWTTVSLSLCRFREHLYSSSPKNTADVRDIDAVDNVTPFKLLSNKRKFTNFTRQLFNRSTHTRRRQYPTATFYTPISN